MNPTAATDSGQNQEAKEMQTYSEESTNMKLIEKE
jgi:hypothetical protein